jgi:tRNA pseudouridine55 synthase
MNGVLVIDKPRGCTSFDVVQRVRRALGTKKAGHTGTLDPMATGVLPVCVGLATRIAGHITLGDKAYDAELRLGAETDTLDADGQVVAEAEVPPLDEAQVEAALARFRGTFLQTPPMYSAVKVGGKRLYELAREGLEVERPAREVTVHQLELLGLQGDRLLLHVRCSKGFFVRTLAQGLGRALGTLAHLTALRRTASGPFTLLQALPLEQLEQDPALAGGRLVSEAAALVELPPFEVDEKDAARVKHGQRLPAQGRGGEGTLRVMGPDGALLALAEAGDDGLLRYLRVLG